MTKIEEAEARIAALEEALREAKAAKPRKLTFKVSDKGAVSVYGLQRFPVTLYAGQWRALISAIPELQVFIENNRGSLATKD